MASSTGNTGRLTLSGTRLFRQNPELSRLGVVSMSCASQKIRTLRQQIPSFECVPGCHDCCGPVTTSPEEMARLPRKTRAEQDAAMEALDCVHLGPNGCTVYDERPLICRLFGTTATLPCPNGRRPVELIHPRVEKQIHAYMAANRQVLV